MLGPKISFLPDGKQGDGLLPWVIAVMLFLTTLALVSAVTLGNGLDNWSRGLTTSLSVQVISADPDDRAQKTDQALKMLRATPGIEFAGNVTDAEVMELLSPWLGELPSDSGLPIPTLIEIRLISPDSVNIPALKQRLTSISPDIRLDDHQAWMIQIFKLATSIRWILAIVVFMIILSTISIVIFGCRAGLATHKESIEIMHMLGAEDNLIAKAFDERYMLHGLKGGIAGTLIAAITLYALSNIVASLGAGLISAIIPQSASLWWLLILPLATCLMTMFTARFTTKRALSKLM
jgi:cell division transport system permease protein